MVGYVRVSTKRQADHGGSLDAQTELLRGYAVENTFVLPLIYQDAASASRKDSHLRRGDLRDAVHAAIESGVPLLVSRIDRLARNSFALPYLDVPGLEIYSIAEGGRVTKRQLRRAIQQAQREAERLSRQATSDWRRNKSSGRRRKPLGPTGEQRRSGAISNMLRADRKVNELADFLERDDDWANASLRHLADHLNEIGIWNLVSERSNVRKPWTADSLQKPLKRARELLATRVELEAEAASSLFPTFDEVYLTE